MSGKFGFLVGVGSLFFLMWMYRSVLKKKGKEKVDKGLVVGGEKRMGEFEKLVKIEVEVLREKVKLKEFEFFKSEFLNKI